MTAYTDCQSQPTVLDVFLSIGLIEARASFFVPAHPLPLALPSPLKPDGHVQVKLPTVFTQVALSTQSAVPMVHSLMSNIA